MLRAIPAVVGILLLATASTAGAQSLQGSPSTMRYQHAIAIEHDYTFLRSSADVRRFVDLGLLVRVGGNADYELASVSYPYARAEVRTFVERLAGQYHAACGQKLVVTSLTRPQGRQPANASDLSVHPAGMAVDLRRAPDARCRGWLERVLLQLEGAGVLDITKENYPPHYHVAIYPRRYASYVARLDGAAARRTLVAAMEDAPGVRQVASGPSVGSTRTYQVDRGDSLWSIARAYGTTVDELRMLNGLNGNRILAGQVLEVPSR